ncbi:Flp pilus assembly protein TadG [Methylopila capsulata]|uniref:Flp pilus assembly protein TadG n=1 Tax=Methylopila capsulata TaxID=61654 RepID=A0A9W6MT70_9HYPH|nr:TadE/TadG family type IV pilus assembly protein [Methylopila capsulata]MBM7852579.1 Flp pilus assembly protein TadG [Methylopila capsulata]GLK56786.1 hypothetical protein GCM10008170_28050 [Methylopila capsulata]
MAVEFALIAPVFISIVAGVVFYGVYFGAANSVQQLAADAARASIAGLSDAERVAIARQHVIAAAPSFVLIDASRTSVTAKPSTSDPNLFEVAVSYDASRLTIWGLDGLLPLPSKTITRTAAVQRGGF